MSKVTLEQIKQLRAKTKAGVMDCRRALKACRGDFKKAEMWLGEKGAVSATKRADRQTACGLIEVYTHADGRVVAIVELLCETDFVARTAGFKKLAHELAMQVAAMDPKNVGELLSQSWIRDEEREVVELVDEMISKTGENIKVGRVARFELGEP